MQPPWRNAWHAWHAGQGSKGRVQGAGASRKDGTCPPEPLALRRGLRQRYVDAVRPIAGVLDAAGRAPERAGSALKGSADRRLSRVFAAPKQPQTHRQRQWSHDTVPGRQYRALRHSSRVQAQCLGKLHGSRRGKRPPRRAAARSSSLRRSLLPQHAWRSVCGGVGRWWRRSVTKRTRRNS